jgi:ubiquinone/menaquinone biosynthesis C-methylase UbiE
MKMSALEKHFVNSPTHTRRVDSHANQLLSRIDYQPGGRYLDVGCGVGTAARMVAATSELSVTAVDIDPEQIATARRGAPQPNLQYKVMDATKLQFADGEFDVVASRMATHHIPDWERAISEMARVLRPGGYLLYTDFALPSWLATAFRIVRLRRFPSAPALLALAQTSGLAPVYESRHSGKRDLVWRKM